MILATEIELFQMLENMEKNLCRNKQFYSVGMLHLKYTDEVLEMDE